MAGKTAVRPPVQPASAAPERPDLTGYGVARGNGVVHLQITDVLGRAAGGSMAPGMSREFARNILAVTGEED